MPASFADTAGAVDCFWELGKFLSSPLDIELVFDERWKPTAPCFLSSRELFISRSHLRCCVLVFLREISHPVKCISSLKGPNSATQVMALDQCWKVFGWIAAHFYIVQAEARMILFSDDKVQTDSLAQSEVIWLQGKKRQLFMFWKGLFKRTCLCCL